MIAHDDVYVYAVRSLPEDEVAQFEAHLAECEPCSAELAALSNVTAELASAVAASPPLSLRSAVMDSLRNAPQGMRRSDTPASTTTQLPRHAATPEAPVVPLTRSRQPRFPAILAAAAVIAALGFGGWAWQSREAAQQQAQQAQAQTVQLTSLLSAADVKTVTGKVTTSGSTATVVMSRSQHTAMFVATGLPSLPAGKVYEAWTITGKPVPAGTFSADTGKATVRLPPQALVAKAVAVTIEPAGGSAAPTSSPIFAVNLPRPA